MVERQKSRRAEERIRIPSTSIVSSLSPNSESFPVVTAATPSRETVLIGSTAFARRNRTLRYTSVISSTNLWSRVPFRWGKLVGRSFSFAAGIIKNCSISDAHALHFEIDSTFYKVWNERNLNGWRLSSKLTKKHCVDRDFLCFWKEDCGKRKQALLVE